MIYDSFVLWFLVFCTVNGLIWLTTVEIATWDIEIGNLICKSSRWDLLVVIPRQNGLLLSGRMTCFLSFILHSVESWSLVDFEDNSMNPVFPVRSQFRTKLDILLNNFLHIQLREKRVSLLLQNQLIIVLNWSNHLLHTWVHKWDNL